MLHHRHSFFPLVLAALTLALIIFMFYAFTGSPRPDATSVVVESSPVSAQEYQTTVTQITQAFIAAYPQQPDELAKLVLVEQTMQHLLSLRVPAEDKEAHLSLVIELNQMQQALRNRSGEAEEAFERFTNYVSN